MEDIELTHGQFVILLNMTNQPADYDEKTASLVSALHNAWVRGHKWFVKMSTQDIELAADLFIAHYNASRSPGAKQSMNFFMRDSTTARRHYDVRMQGDVPRETKES